MKKTRNKYEFPYTLTQREKKPSYWFNPATKEWEATEWVIKWLPLKDQLNGLNDSALVDAGIAIGRMFGFDLLTSIVRRPYDPERK